MQQQTSAYAKKDMSSGLIKLQGSISKIRASVHKIDTSMSGLGKWVNDKGNVDGLTKALDTMNRGYRETYKNPKGFTIFSSKPK